MSTPTPKELADRLDNVKSDLHGIRGCDIDGLNLAAEYLRQLEVPDDELYLCACEQFYKAHHDECPAKRQYDALSAQLAEMTEKYEQTGCTRHHAMETAISLYEKERDISDQLRARVAELGG